MWHRPSGRSAWDWQRTVAQMAARGAWGGRSWLSAEHLPDKRCQQSCCCGPARIAPSWEWGRSPSSCLPCPQHPAAAASPDAEGRSLKPWCLGDGTMGVPGLSAQLSRRVGSCSFRRASGWEEPACVALLPNLPFLLEDRCPPAAPVSLTASSQPVHPFSIVPSCPTLLVMMGTEEESW